MADFDERSGIIACATDWGQWWQTIDEIIIEVNLESNCRAKDIKCECKTNYLKVVVKGNTVIDGNLTSSVHSADMIWTVESEANDERVMRICLMKTNKTAENCWKSLLVGQFEADPFLYDQMEQKLTLHRFQLENPGMDFSAATVTGNYTKGGPKMPT